MTVRRLDRHSQIDHNSGERLLPIAETMRTAAAPRSEPAKSSDERVSLFWRVFGGTILSIVALLFLTAYQNIANSLQELRGEISHLNEAKADLVKKDDYAASRARTWDKIQEVQKDAAAAAMPINQLKDRVGAIEELLRSQAAERKEAAALQQAVASLQEKGALRDQQLKQLEEERKELLREIQLLRERLARVEASKEPRTSKSADDAERAK